MIKTVFKKLLPITVLLISAVIYAYSYNITNYITKASLPLLSLHNNYLYILGTTLYGADALYIIVKSTLSTVLYGSIITVISTALALFIGIIKGYYKQYIDTLLQRLYEIIISIPLLYLLLMLVGLVNLTFWQIIIIVGVFNSAFLVNYIRNLSLQHAKSNFIGLLKQCHIPNYIIITKYLSVIIINKLKYVIVFSFFSNMLFLMLADFLNILPNTNLIQPMYANLVQQSFNNPWAYNLIIASALPLLLLCYYFVKIIKHYTKTNFSQNKPTINNIKLINLKYNNIILANSGSGKSTTINYIKNLHTCYLMPQNTASCYSNNLSIQKHFKHLSINHNIFALFNINASLLKRYPNTVSLGQLQWITLAFALSNNHQHILLDEPTSSLDNTHIAKLITILQTINHKYKKHYTITTHSHGFAIQLSQLLSQTNSYTCILNNNVINIQKCIISSYNYLPPKNLLPAQNNVLLSISNFKLSNDNSYNINIVKNQINLIIGKNGIGKTTLLNTISNKVKCSYIVQNYGSMLNKNFKIITIIKQVAKKHKVSNKTIIHTLKQLNLSYTDIKNKGKNQLSMGQLQRILLLIMLIQKPKVLILDEPTSGLDYTNNKNYCHLLNYINQQHGITIILVSHNVVTNNSVNYGNLITLN